MCMINFNVRERIKREKVREGGRLHICTISFFFQPCLSLPFSVVEGEPSWLLDVAPAPSGTISCGYPGSGCPRLGQHPVIAGLTRPIRGVVATVPAILRYVDCRFLDPTRLAHAPPPGRACTRSLLSDFLLA